MADSTDHSSLLASVDSSFKSSACACAVVWLFAGGDSR